QTGGSVRTSGKRGGSPVPLLLVGLALLVIGYIGYFFGQLIKAALSREREFLADASSVQFTRNPAGLAGALKKIGGYYYDGSQLHAERAHEASHLFFAAAVATPFLNLLATHPPLDQRIRAIDPGWDGSVPQSNAEV